MAASEFAPSPPSRRSDRWLLAILLGGLAALLIGWLAFLISGAGVAPVVLFPLVVGLAIGAAQTAIVRQLKLPQRCGAAAVVALVCGALAVAVQDYAGYRAYREEYLRVQNSDARASVVQAAGEPWQAVGFWTYLAAVIRRNRLWWSVDAGLTPLAAAALAGAMSRRHPSVAQPERSADAGGSADTV